MSFVEATCVTCNRVLRVSDPSLMGSITVCPACGSMVEVPDQSSARQDNEGSSEVESVDSQALTVDGMELDEDLNAPKTPVTENFVPEPPPINQSPADTGQPQKEATTDQVDPENRVHRSTIRPVLLVAGIATASITVAAILFGIFVWRQTETPEAQAIASADLSSTEKPPTSEKKNDTRDAPPADPTSPSSKSQTDVEQSADELNSEPIVKPDADQSADTNRDMSGDTDTTTLPKDLIPRSPLEPDSEDSLSPLSDNAMEPSAKPEEAQADIPTEEPRPSPINEPDVLAEFMPLLLQEPPLEANLLEAPGINENLVVDAAAEVDSIIGIEPPPPVRPLADLSRRAYFKHEAYPADRFALLVSQWTGVPVQIDWLAFDLVDRDPRSAIVLGDKAKTANQWLELMAGAIGGQMTIEETLVRIEPADSVFSAAHQRITDLSDLATAPGQEPIASPTKLIEQFLPAFNAQDKGEELAKADEDELEDRSTMMLRIVACEILRRMRGVPGKLANERLAKWTRLSTDLDFDWQVLGDGQATQSTDLPLPIISVIRRLAVTNDVSILLPWNDLQRRGFLPTRLRVLLPVQNASEQTRELLAPYKLQMRVIDDSHWWVGPDSVYDRLPLVLFSEPTGGKHVAFMAMIDRLVAQTDQNSFYRMVHDPVSDRVMLVLPRYLARQLPKAAESLVANR
ncbi:MAG: hypothetical protein AAF664_16440 [Planctomycetota bacterium]